MKPGWDGANASFQPISSGLCYVFGYWLWTRLSTRPSIPRQPAMVIFDRYAYDMALNQGRVPIGFPEGVARWFIASAPMPNVISCLYGNPEGIAVRNQESSVEQTGGQVEAIQAFASREPRAALVSADTRIEETRDQVLNALCAFLQTRAAVRL